ncbi:MAG: hypothetical protein Q8O13_09790 [Candidatus Omnitrophota bacterium]|nr:hypothetical protein [Candidatus Omnitrophota bacterium]
MSQDLKWDETVLKKFNLMIQKMPLFHRRIAEDLARNKAEANAKERKSNIVQEMDVVKAFFSEVPKPFYSLMIRLMENVGFDYKEFALNQKIK